MERAIERYEEMDFRAQAVSDGVLIEADPLRGWSWSWSDLGGFHVTVLVRLPERYNADIESSDGDIRIERLAGDATLRTSDGDVRVEQLTGHLRLRTSDGDVRLGEITGEAEVQTSDGDIVLHAVRGPEAYLKTSDGDITFDEIAAEMVELRTSDGEIRGGSLESQDIEIHTSDGGIDLEGVAGALRATTSDGDVVIGISRLEATYVQSGDGDIEIALGAGQGADIDLRGARVRLPSRSELDGRLGRKSAHGRLNGGGPELRAVARDGTVQLRTRDSG
jgi:DUF4097 and DUF4098 domain-containing protein YvlB